MNILPKKSWHVRNKDNVAKVRKDEEEARNEEKKRLQQIALAEQEARTDLLRRKVRKSSPSDSSAYTSLLAKDGQAKSINFFQNVGPDGKPYSLSATNAEHEKEKQLEKEKAEKKLGVLTYLGQSAVELLPDEERPWYFKAPQRGKDLPNKEPSKSEIADKKRKTMMDPLVEMKGHLKKKKKKHKHEHKRHKSSKIHSSSKHLSSDDKLAKLRKERLEREAREKQHSLHLLQKHFGSSETDVTSSEPPSFVPKYNNQFNPRLARNNKYT